MPYFDFGTLQNPFEKIPAGTMQRVNYANPGTGDSGPPGPEYLPTQEDAWGLSEEYMTANPQGFSVLSNPNNFQVLGQNEDGSYNVKLKTADKQGSIFNLHQDENGRWQETPVSQEYWDTNVSWDKRFGFVIPLVAGAAWAGAVAAAGAYGVAGPSGSVLGDLAGSAATGSAGAAAGNATTTAAQFAAADAAQLAAQGIGQAQIEQILVASGLDPFIAADAAGLAVQNIGEASILQNLTASYGTNLTGGSGAYIPTGPGNVFGYTGTPNTTWSPTGQEIPLAGQPGWDPGTGGTTLPGASGTTTTTPGATGPSGPTVNPPGGTGGTGGTDASAISLLDWLMRMYDAYNKGKKQEEYADEMFRWANKIFGQSANFENMLMDTYTNPTGWLEGPEGAALNRIVQNQNLRTDSRAGNLSNDTNRSVVLQDQMMKGLGNYRTGLGQSAALGRNASAVALDAVGKAIKSDYNASQWYTPLTYGAGQSGTPSVGGTISSLWNDVKNLGGAANEAWKWFTGLTGSP